MEIHRESTVATKAAGSLRVVMITMVLLIMLGFVHAADSNHVRMSIVSKVKSVRRFMRTNIIVGMLVFFSTDSSVLWGPCAVDYFNYAQRCDGQSLRTLRGRTAYGISDMFSGAITSCAAL